MVCWESSVCYVFFFQAEDGIRDLVRSRGLGDVYKRQVLLSVQGQPGLYYQITGNFNFIEGEDLVIKSGNVLSLIHI